MEDKLLNELKDEEIRVSLEDITISVGYFGNHYWLMDEVGLVLHSLTKDEARRLLNKYAKEVD